ncbi:MAG: TA system VapC family ribonuclease toxin [Thermodesulfobacteriota bacterium]|nr:TA system VapC family ribonuclease toxin [Thermodesulfobacteriota bacterium]
MIAVDTNILVYAHREESPFHKKALACITELSEGRASWAIPWPCIHEFFSIATHPRIYDPPSPTQCVVDQLDAWIESPTLVFLSETPDYWVTLRTMVNSSQVSGPMIHDARIAALCIQNGVTELLTADRDFGRFRELKTRNPLVS